MNTLNLIVSLFAIVVVVNPIPIKYEKNRWNWPKPVMPNRQYFNTSGGSVAKVVEGNVVFHAFKQFNESYTTNIIEFPSQLIVIDFGSSPLFGVNASQYAKTLNKQTITCFLTHEHPDHFYGYDAWKDLCTNTYALNETLDRLKNYANSTNVYQSTAQTFLNASQTISTPTSLLFDNVNVVFEKLVNIESAFFLFIRMPSQKAMFAGDIVTLNHMFLENNHDLSTWYEALVKFRWLGYRNVFYGHGFPLDYSNNNAFYQQLKYLKFVRDVANTYKTQEKYTSTIFNRYPTLEGGNVVPCPFLNCAPYSNP